MSAGIIHALHAAPRPSQARQRGQGRDAKGFLQRTRPLVVAQVCAVARLRCAFQDPWIRFGMRANNGRHANRRFCFRFQHPTNPPPLVPTLIGHETPLTKGLRGQLKPGGPTCVSGRPTVNPSQSPFFYRFT
jgi:hypothetical protein